MFSLNCIWLGHGSLCKNKLFKSNYGMYTNSSGKATSKYVQKNSWPSAFSLEKMWNSCLARELRPLSSEKHTGIPAEVGDANATSATRFLPCHGICLWRKYRQVELHLLAIKIFLLFVATVRIFLQSTQSCETFP